MFIDAETALFSIDESFSESAKPPSETLGNESSFLKRNESDLERVSIGKPT